MSDYTYITKKCPFCGNTMYREDETKNTIDYLCYDCGFIAEFVADLMTEDERRGKQNDN